MAVSNTQPPLLAGKGGEGGLPSNDGTQHHAVPQQGVATLRDLWPQGLQLPADLWHAVC